MPNIFNRNAKTLPCFVTAMNMSTEGMQMLPVEAARNLIYCNDTNFKCTTCPYTL